MDIDYSNSIVTKQKAVTILEKILENWATNWTKQKRASEKRLRKKKPRGTTSKSKSTRSLASSKKSTLNLQEFLWSSRFFKKKKKGRSRRKSLTSLL